MKNNSNKAEQFQELINSLITITLVRLSDAEHQKREWLKTRKTAYVYQLDTMEDCFDQFTDVYFKMLKHADMRLYLGDTNADLIEKFYNAFRTYAWDTGNCVPECCLDLDVEEALRDPRWHEIQRLAKDAYNALTHHDFF